MRILFFRLGAIGDVLMTTPLVRQVRENFPDAKIDYLVGKQVACVLKGNKNINRVIEVNEQIFIKKDIFKWLSLIKKIRDRNYDVIFVLMKHWIFNLTAFLFGIKKRVGFDRFNWEGILLTHKIPYNKLEHEIYYYLDLAKKAGLKVNYNDSSMNLALSKKDKQFAASILKKYILSGEKLIGIAPAGCSNPVSRSREKQWPIKNYENLAEALIKRNFSVLLLGDKNDEYAGAHFSENKGVINLIGKTTIQEAAALIKKFHYFISNDTGLMHIAASSNKRVIGIFGPTNPKRFAPLWKESVAIWKDSKNYDFKADLVGKYSGDIFMKKINVQDILKVIK